MIPSKQAREEQPTALALEQDLLSSLLLQVTVPTALAALPPPHPNSTDQQNITLVQRRVRPGDKEANTGIWNREAGQVLGLEDKRIFKWEERENYN